MGKNIRQAVLLTALAGFAAFSASAQSEQTTTSGLGSSSGSSSDAKATSQSVDRKTTEFIRDAARDNNTEIALAEIAARKAQNPELKAFAEKLQQDHQQAQQQLQALAQKHAVTLEDATKAKTESAVAKFEKEEAGAKWDKNFATEALKGHAKDIAMYHEALGRLQAEDLKQFAQAQIPHLHQHFEQAQTVAQAVGVDQSTISSYAKKIPASVGGTGDELHRIHGTGSSTNQDSTYPKQGSGSSDLKNETSPR